MQCPTNASARPSTILTNTTVSTWVSDTSQSGYSYHADITHPDITVDMPASVIYSPTDASSGNYAPICQTGTGYVRIFSKVNTSITIPTIKIEGAINYYELQGTVGSDTKPIKIVNGQAVAITNSLQPTLVYQHVVGNTNLTSAQPVYRIASITASKTGTAYLTLKGQFANNSAGYRLIGFSRNSTTVQERWMQNIMPNGDYCYFSSTCTLSITQGDVIGICAYQTSGSTIGIGVEMDLVTF